MGFSNFSHVITYKSEVLLARTCKCPHRGKNDLTGLVCLYSSVLIKAGLHVQLYSPKHGRYRIRYVLKKKKKYIYTNKK